MRAGPADHDFVVESALQERGVRAPGTGTRGAGAWARSSALGADAGAAGARHSSLGGVRNGHGRWAVDFNGNFSCPAQEILNGVSPYHPGRTATRARRGRGRASARRVRARRVRDLPGARRCCSACRSRLSRSRLAEWLWVGLMLAPPAGSRCDRRRARLARLRRRAAGAGRRHTRSCYGIGRLRPHARPRGQLALARPRLARRARARRIDRDQAGRRCRWSPGSSPTRRWLRRRTAAASSAARSGSPAGR